MKISRYLYVVALVFGLTGLAKADGIDFKMIVVDGPIYGYSIENTSPFPVTFGGCPDSLTNAGASGCFNLYNDTGLTITGLDLTFSNSLGANDYLGLNGQTPDCASSPIFEDVSGPCVFTGPANSTSSTYTLDFGIGQGSGIAPGSTVFLAEYGVDPTAFGTGSGSVTLSAATPEPDSILLLSTGVLMFGIFFASKRRRNAGISRF